MSEESEPTLIDVTALSLERMQKFDVERLPRESDLGKVNFKDAIAPAQKLVSLYQRLTVDALEDFPEKILNTIKGQCDADYQRFQEILDFDVSTQQEPPGNVRDRYIQQLESAYASAFTTLHQYIAYSLHRSADFERLSREARATFQGIKDEAAETQQELNTQKTDAESILKDIRETAAEHGVTQQAFYFQTESGAHDADATLWERRTFGLAVALGLFAVATVFLHKWEWIAPTNTFETVQLVTSKILIFGVLTYMLILSAKNYLNHKHNSIVNKHRQNALMTYKEMVDATDDPGSREAILIQAAACIYSAQPTGYAPGGDTQQISGKSMVEILSKPVVQAATNSGK
jgi:hypothetical protein